MKFLLPLALLVPDWTYGNSFTVSNTLPDDLSSASNVFGKSVEVFGLRGYSRLRRLTPRVLHTANVLAEYLDNDENGSVDQPEVLKAPGQLEFRNRHHGSLRLRKRTGILR